MEPGPTGAAPAPVITAQLVAAVRPVERKAWEA